MRILEVDFKSTKSELSELKKTSAQYVKKADSMEKEIQSMKTILEDVQKAVKPGGRPGANGAGSTTRHSSSDVS